MKQYDVYGIGHALVDLEFEVTDDFLNEIGVTKGTMQLVDATRQHELLARCADLKRRRSCGGSAANSVIGVAQFGGRGFFSCKVSNDGNGDFFAAEMLAQGVDNRLREHLEPGTTGSCLVFITPDAERTMCTNLGISVTLSADHLVPEALRNSKLLYVEGYLVSARETLEAALAGVAMAREQGVAVALTFSDQNMVKYFRSGFDALLGDGVDLIFCNEAEARVFTGIEDPIQAGAALRKLARGVVITRGAQGAAIWQGDDHHAIPGVAVTPVDTNGAGDLFAGAYMYGITNGLDIPAAGALACNAAAVLVTQFGARLRPGQAAEIAGNLG